MNRDDLIWEDEALETLKKIPFFARKIAKKKIELGAIELGEQKITPELMEKIRNQVMGSK